MLNISASQFHGAKLFWKRWYHWSWSEISLLFMEAGVSLSCQTNPVHAFPHTFIKMNFNIIPSSTRAFSKWSPSFRFPHQNPVCISLRYVQTVAGNHSDSPCVGSGGSLPGVKRLDSSVGLAPRYALADPETCLWGGGFRTRPRWPWGPPSPYNGYWTVFFRVGVDDPPHVATRLKKE
jgi:hypothetical protein